MILVRFILVFAFLAPGFCFAQATYTAQLRGTITDSTAAVIPSAKVTVTDDATGVSETISSDGQGRYLFASLRPASYTVKVELTGFKTVVRPNVVLRVSQQTDLDFTLEVG